MAELDFRYYVLANDATVRCGNRYARVEKVKVHFHYEGQSLNLLLRFGKGTEQPSKNITVLFDLEASHIEVFGVQTIRLSIHTPYGYGKSIWNFHMDMDRMDIWITYGHMD